MARSSKAAGLAVNPAWRYLPAVETAQSERSALIERANACGSALRILNDEFGLGIPEESGSKSWKINCPYQHEHPDGGVDKNCRFYWESDRAYCFADHGVLDFVALRAMQWGIAPMAAARRIVEAHEESSARKPWWERAGQARTRLLHADQPPPMSTQHAQAALIEALRAREGYVEAQYRPDVRKALQDVLEALDPSWDFDQTLSWVTSGADYIHSKVEESP